MVEKAPCWLCCLAFWGAGKDSQSLSRKVRQDWERVQDSEDRLIQMPHSLELILMGVIVTGFQVSHLQAVFVFSFPSFFPSLPPSFLPSLLPSNPPSFLLNIKNKMTGNRHNMEKFIIGAWEAGKGQGHLSSSNPPQPPQTTEAEEEEEEASSKRGKRRAGA